MRGFPALMLGLAVASTPAAADDVAAPADDAAPVMLIQFTRTARAIEVRLQATAPLKDACWTMTGPNSPYLIAAEHRYPLIGGDRITACPKGRDYAEGEVMVLRFAPLRPNVTEFSLIEGVGGESQILDPDSATRRYWNFLHVKAK